MAKYSSNGTLLWTQQLGTPTYDESEGVATDHSGNVFISGWTYGDLKGSSKGGADAWVAKYSPNGKLLGLRQNGGQSDDFSEGVAVDGSGNVVMTGWTEGRFAK